MKEEKGKTVVDKREASSWTNKKALALLLKPAISYHIIRGHQDRATEILLNGDTVLFLSNKILAVLRGSAARRRISVPMCDQCTACNPHWHVRPRYSTINKVHRITPDLAQHTLFPQYHTPTHPQLKHWHH